MGTRVDKGDLSDLLPKVAAEKMTWRLPRGKQALVKRLLSMGVDTCLMSRPLKDQLQMV